MTKIDPIIAVRDIVTSVAWYQSVFDCKRKHGGDDFAVLVDHNDEVLICLHKWGQQEHPTMTNPDIVPGNGLIFYYKTDDMESIRRRIESIDYPVEDDIHVNPNSGKKEFSLRDQDGYYWIVTEYHTYEG